MFFSKLAVVSFGGAYALLAYMAQQAVETYDWMTAPEMVDGLGLAETTPGPLILVTQFVGFLAAFREAAPFSPVAAGVLGAAHDHLGHVRAVDAVDLRRRAVRRAAARQPAARPARSPPSPPRWSASSSICRSGSRCTCCSASVTEDALRPAALVRFRSAARSTLTPRSLAVIAAVLAFGLHRSLIEVVVVMALLGDRRAIIRSC